MGRARSQQSIDAERLYQKGYSIKEIVEKLSVPEGTVRRWKSTQKWPEPKANKKRTKTEQGKPKKNGAPFGNKNALGSHPGAPVGNTNALKHGGYSKIYWDTLDEEEKKMLEELDYDGEQLLIDEISLLSVRERRIMASIAKHKAAKGGQAVSAITRSEEKREFANDEERQLYEERIADDVASGERLPGRAYRLTTTTEATYDIVHRLEEALTRCQAQKQKCIESLNKLRFERGDDGKAAPENNLLQALLAATTEDIDTDDIPELEQASDDSDDMVE